MSEKPGAGAGDRKRRKAANGSDAEAAPRPDGNGGNDPGPAGELEDLRDKYLRLSADFDNYRKRLAREKQEILDFGNAGRLKELLFVLDNIERAIDLSEESVGEKTGFAAFLDGIKLVRTQFVSSLRGFGVTEIDASRGTGFDPSYHEAVYKERSDECGGGTIISEIQKGYLLNGRLLRPSMVSVSEGSGEEPEEDSEKKD